MTELLLMFIGAGIAVGAMALNEALSRAKHSARIGKPPPGSAVVQSTRRTEEDGTVTHIIVVPPPGRDGGGECWGDPEGVDDYG